MANAKTITARSLLLEFLNLRSMSPKLREWTEEQFANNPPRLFRLRQLVALFRAFGIPWNPTSFVQGKFIEPDLPRYAALLSKLTAEMPHGSAHWTHSHQLPQFFSILLDFRKRVENVLDFSSGVQEASGLYLHAHRKAGELNSVIQDNIAIIEGTLVELISPEAAAFSIEQLTRDFEYPDVDLFEIDLNSW